MKELKSALLVALILLIPAVCFSAEQPEPAVTIGHKDYLDSKSLGEKREIYVYIPDVTQGVKVPVLVALDGEYSFLQAATITRHLTSAGRLPPMAIVGVVNKNRGRDMNPGFEGSELATNDASAHFLSFLCDELVPYLEQKYPLSGHRTLVGGSQAGLFMMYAFARRPEVFQADVFISLAAGDERIQASLLVLFPVRVWDRASSLSAWAMRRLILRWAQPDSQKQSKKTRRLRSLSTTSTSPGRHISLAE